MLMMAGYYCLSVVKLKLNSLQNLFVAHKQMHLWNLGSQRVVCLAFENKPLLRMGENYCRCGGFNFLAIKLLNDHM